jgi:putative hydrolase of the HAD superfamily
VFDLGNVLIPFDYNLFLKKLDFRKEGLAERFAQRYKTGYHIHRDFERGNIPRAEFLKIMLDWVEQTMTAEEFCVEFSSIFSLNEDVAALLPRLKKKYRLVLLSNTNEIHYEYGWANYEFLKHFDKLIPSHLAGAVKPEEKIYRKVEEFSGVEPANHLFIDDIAEYVEGAKKVGWDAVQFTGYENLISDLSNRGIEF